jgi:hypothetical protein
MIGNDIPKLEIMVNGVSASAAGTVGGTAIPYVDTLGRRCLEIAVIGTTSDAATNNPSVLKVQTSDTGSATNVTDVTWSDVTALVGDGTGGFTIPASPTTTTVKPYALLRCDMRGKGRYARLVVSPLTTQTFTVLARLSEAFEMPDTAAEAGVAVVACG